MKTYITVHAVARFNGKYLILQRAPHRSSPGKWNNVTGYVKDRESAEEAAIRELKEETNLEGGFIKSTEPFWVDREDVRWVVVASLIEVKDIKKIKIDENESQAHKWISPDDDIVDSSEAMKMCFQKLGIS